MTQHATSSPAPTPITLPTPTPAPTTAPTPGPTTLPAATRRPGRRPARVGPPPARRRGHGEAGITTAEYAVGTAAGAGLAGLLFKLLTGDLGQRLLRMLFDHVLGLLGIG